MALSRSPAPSAHVRNVSGFMLEVAVFAHFHKVLGEAGS